MPEVMSSLDLCLISGDPGSGKTTTAVAKLRDAYTGTAKGLDKYKLNGKFHLFANTTLFGMQFMYLPLPSLIEHFNTTINGLPLSDPRSIPLVGYGYYLYDEGYQGANARESGSSDTKIHQSLTLQSRKRHLKLIYIAQDLKLLTWELRKFATEWIHCERPDKNSSIITVTIKKSGQPKRTFSYDGSQYWRYFRSDQLHAMSDSRLAKAYERAL